MRLWEPVRHENTAQGRPALFFRMPWRTDSGPPDLYLVLDAHSRVRGKRRSHSRFHREVPCLRRLIIEIGLKNGLFQLRLISSIAMHLDSMKQSRKIFVLFAVLLLGVKPVKPLLNVVWSKSRQEVANSTAYFQIQKPARRRFYERCKTQRKLPLNPERKFSLQFRACKFEFKVRHRTL